MEEACPGAIECSSFRLRISVCAVLGCLSSPDDVQGGDDDTDDDNYNDDSDDSDENDDEDEENGKGDDDNDNGDNDYNGF